MTTTKKNPKKTASQKGSAEAQCWVFRSHEECLAASEVLREILRLPGSVQSGSTARTKGTDGR